MHMSHGTRFHRKPSRDLELGRRSNDSDGNPLLPNACNSIVFFWINSTELDKQSVQYFQYQLQFLIHFPCEYPLTRPLWMRHEGRTGDPLKTAGGISDHQCP